MDETIAEFKRITPDLKAIEYEHYDYAKWKSLRDAGQKPRSIYAGAILVCQDTASIYVHKRSTNVALEPGKFHGFYGGFIVKQQHIADDNLTCAALREVLEASAAQPNLDQARVFMAGTLRKENVPQLKGSHEGEVVPITFDKIAESICKIKNSWVKSGIAHHLTWLKLGAPGAPSWFADEKALEAYRRICEGMSS